MASEEISKLDQLDLSRLTVDDIRNLKNTVLREALLEVLRRKRDPLASFQQHISHEEHYTSPEVMRPTFEARRNP
ncbi:MAG TPA: hypothetical protein VGX21_06145 [Methylomirabilota bacterium]|jgi:hypothetical protein|nr:hypothetical protein [Methylomirabilota bacterium]